MEKFCGLVLSSGLEATRGELVAPAARNVNEYLLMHLPTREIVEGYGGEI
jgi:hypothetical protein